MAQPSMLQPHPGHGWGAKAELQIVSTLSRSQWDPTKCLHGTLPLGLVVWGLNIMFCPSNQPLKLPECEQLKYFLSAKRRYFRADKFCNAYAVTGGEKDLLLPAEFCMHSFTAVCHSSEYNCDTGTAILEWRCFFSGPWFTHGGKAGVSLKPRKVVHGAGLDWTNATQKFSLKHQKNPVVAVSRTRLQNSLHSWWSRELQHWDWFCISANTSHLVLSVVKPLLV